MASDLRVAVLYPWPGLPATDRGAARRVMPLVSLISEKCGDVTVLSPGEGKCVRQGKIEFIFHRPAAWEQLMLRWLFRLYDGITHHISSGRMSARERRQWWHFFRAGLQPSLSRKIRETIRYSDVVLLEYPFWFRQARRAAGSRPIILTLHDLLSGMISQPWLGKIVRNREIEACRGVSDVICVSESDRSELASLGIKATLVPHGLDLDRCNANPPVSRPDLAAVEQHRQKGGMVCFFVGSSLEPNRRAVEAISNMARHLQREEAILFVVAGACCGPGRMGRNMICTGPVTDTELGFLYAQTDVVLAPIPSGTGASTKVIEAMAWGRALLITSAGGRGLKIMADRDCLVCDDLAQYPTLLLNMLRNPQQVRDLARRAREFARDYDYRVVYRPYLAMLDGIQMRVHPPASPA